MTECGETRGNRLSSSHGSSVTEACVRYMKTDLDYKRKGENTRKKPLNFSKENVLIIIIEISQLDCQDYRTTCM